MKQKIKRKVFIDKLLGFRWHIQIGGTNEDCVKWLNKKHKANYEARNDVSGTFFKKGSNDFECGIWVNKFGTYVTSHEIYHAVTHVLTTLAVPHDANSEVGAMYTEFLWSCMFKTMEKK